ncbi:hypothetical protein BGZ65_002109 [Modicella reniformis]|uniref:THO complex subunit 1 n=1 Tax=Modicella reniformis TaxID=1440133 RepID=A0A9P6INC2_9FUNG|nr:hypothetical protein BGZ65_002109 [Modicella reniformis]
MAAPRAKGAASVSQASTSTSPFKDQPNVLDASIRATLVPTLERHRQLDKAALLEAAFKQKLIAIQDELGTNITELKDAMFRCLDLLLRCSELELLDPSTPLNYIEEVLDFQTVECCEHIYDYIESRDTRLTVGMVAGRGKGLTLLRLCNELLRRLSKANNTKFRARILMFQSSLFPLTERSGVNLKGDFNTENVTLIETDEATMVPELALMPRRTRSEGENQVPNGESMDVDEVDSVTVHKEQRKDNDLDNAAREESLTFYAEFWSLQSFFCNPATLINSPKNIAKFQKGIERTLDKFAAIEENDQRTHEQGSTPSSFGSQEYSKSAEQPIRNSSAAGTKRKHTQINETTPGSSTHFPEFLTKLKLLQLELGYAQIDETTSDSSAHFAKFLTSPKLLQLEMVDPYFRKHILVQFLIIIQYLESHNANAKDAYAKIRTPNKSFQPQWVMEDKDQEWAASIKPRIFKELKATGEESGDDKFLQTVNAVLNHEESWVQWKAESCPSFEKPPMTPDEVEENQKKRQKLSAALTPLKQKLGCATLTDLWRDVEEQFDEDTGFGSNRPPRTVDEYLPGLPFEARRAHAMRLREGKGPLTEQETKELEQSRLWRGLRLGSRQYLHLYGKVIADTNYSAAKLSADIKEDERWEEEIKENGGKVPTPKAVETTSMGPTTEAASPEAKSTLESTGSDEKSDLAFLDRGGGRFDVVKGDNDIDMREGDLAGPDDEESVATDKMSSKDTSSSVKDNTSAAMSSTAVGTEPIVISLTNKKRDIDFS